MRKQCYTCGKRKWNGVSLSTKLEKLMNEIKEYEFQFNDKGKIIDQLEEVNQMIKRSDESKKKVKIEKPMQPNTKQPRKPRTRRFKMTVGSDEYTTREMGDFICNTEEFKILKKELKLKPFWVHGPDGKKFLDSYSTTVVEPYNIEDKLISLGLSHVYQFAI